jgi:hypothetical protein
VHLGPVSNIYLPIINGRFGLTQTLHLTIRSFGKHPSSPFSIALGLGRVAAHYGRKRNAPHSMVELRKAHAR